MNILSWNILSGGFDSYSDTSPRPQRLDGLIKAVKKADADFVSLVDTFRWTEVLISDELKQLFGYPNVYSVKLEDQRLIDIGHDNGITVLTKTPVSKFETIRLSNRNAIKTQAELDGNRLDIYSVYLDDLSEDTRLQQVQTLFQFINPSAPSIFLGDLNTFASSDIPTTQANVDKLKSQFPNVIKNMEPTLKEMARGEVVKWIKKQGFVDLSANSGNTTPAKLFPIKVDTPLARIDFAFGSKDIVTSNFEVLTDEPFASLSDHYPIKLTI